MHAQAARAGASRGEGLPGAAAAGVDRDRQQGGPQGRVQGLLRQVPRRI